MHDVGLNVDQLVVEQRLDQRVGVPAQLRVGRLGDHDGAQRPDGVLSGQRLGEASCVLLHAVQGPLHPVDALQRLC